MYGPDVLGLGLLGHGGALVGFPRTTWERAAAAWLLDGCGSAVREKERRSSRLNTR
jgi:hypothetical protein